MRPTVSDYDDAILCNPLEMDPNSLGHSGVRSDFQMLRHWELLPFVKKGSGLPEALVFLHYIRLLRSIVFAKDHAGFGVTPSAGQRTPVLLSIGSPRRNSILHSDKFTEDRGFSDPPVNVTTIVSDLESISLDSLYEMQVLHAAYFTQDDIPGFKRSSWIDRLHCAELSGFDSR